MNKIFKKTTALFSAAVMTVCGSMGCFPTVFAEEGKEVEVIFDFVLDKNKIEPDYRKDGELCKIITPNKFTRKICYKLSLVWKIKIC